MAYSKRPTILKPKINFEAHSFGIKATQRYLKQYNIVISENTIYKYKEKGLLTTKNSPLGCVFTKESINSFIQKIKNRERIGFFASEAHKYLKQQGLIISKDLIYDYEKKGLLKSIDDSISGDKVYTRESLDALIKIIKERKNTFSESQAENYLKQYDIYIDKRTISRYGKINRLIAINDEVTGNKLYTKENLDKFIKLIQERRKIGIFISQVPEYLKQHNINLDLATINRYRKKKIFTIVNDTLTGKKIYTKESLDRFIKLIKERKEKGFFVSQAQKYLIQNGVSVSEATLPVYERKGILKSIKDIISGDKIYTKESLDILIENIKDRKNKLLISEAQKYLKQQGIKLSTTAINRYANTKILNTSKDFTSGRNLYTIEILNELIEQIKKRTIGLFGVQASQYLKSQGINISPDGMYYYGKKGIIDSITDVTKGTMIYTKESLDEFINNYLKRKELEKKQSIELAKLNEYAKSNAKELIETIKNTKTLIDLSPEKINYLFLLAKDNNSAFNVLLRLTKEQRYKFSEIYYSYGKKYGYSMDDLLHTCNLAIWNSLNQFQYPFRSSVQAQVYIWRYLKAGISLEIKGIKSKDLYLEEISRFK